MRHYDIHILGNLARLDILSFCEGILERPVPYFGVHGALQILSFLPLIVVIALAFLRYATSPQSSSTFVSAAAAAKM